MSSSSESHGTHDANATLASPTRNTGVKALEAIERIIRTNIVENDQPNRMLIGDEWHTGPVVDTAYRMLKGIHKIAARALSTLEAPEPEREPVAWTNQDGLDYLKKGYGIDVSAERGSMGRAIPLYASPLPTQIRAEPSDEMVSREAVFRIYETLNSGVPYTQRECQVSYALHQVLYPTAALSASITEKGSE